MNASELNRKLLYCGYTDVADYLRDNPLNRRIYKLLLDVMPETWIDVPAVALLNEVYFQCVRVNFDNSPELDVGQRYIAEGQKWLKSELAARLVFAIVWALLDNKGNLTFHEEVFLGQLTSYVERGEFMAVVKTLGDDIRNVPLSVPDEFRPMTCPIDDIPDIFLERMRRIPNSAHFILASLEGEGFELKRREWQEYNEAWKELTDNYSRVTIEKYLRLYPDINDKWCLIGRIESTLSMADMWDLGHRFNDIMRSFEERERSLTVSTVAESLHQTINIAHADQVNINPQKVINNSTPDG